MKNIHLIPTSKPSKLKQNKITKKLSLVNKGIDLTAYTPINIYITSDEEIQEKSKLNTKDYYYIKNHYNEWYVGKFNGKSFDFINNQGNFSSTLFTCKKIILTDSKDLIANNVQAIDNEFLEWFVKNPSCEEVEIVIMNGGYDSPKDVPYQEYYKMLIPKEEPKQENCCTPIGQIKRYKDCIGCDRKPKQETLEEASQYYAHNYFDMHEINNYKALKQGFEAGAKWQAERMYSKEEVEVIAKDAYSMGRNNILIGVFNKWFNQFKKK